MIMLQHALPKLSFVHGAGRRARNVLRSEISLTCPCRASESRDPAQFPKFCDLSALDPALRSLRSSAGTRPRTFLTHTGKAALFPVTFSFDFCAESKALPDNQLIVVADAVVRPFCSLGSRAEIWLCHPWRRDSQSCQSSSIGHAGRQFLIELAVSLLASFRVVARPSSS